MSTLGNNLFAQYYAQNKNNPIIRDGLILYIPMDNHRDYAYTGQQITYMNGDVGVYGKYKGIPCRTVSNAATTHRLEIDVDNIPIGNAPRTFTFWYCRHSISSGVTLGGYGDFLYAKRWSMCEQIQSINLVLTQHVNPSRSFKPQQDTWVFLAFTYDGSICKIYGNGNQLVSSLENLNTSKTIFSIMGSDILITDYRMSGVRVYNRVLSQNEITRLYQEFTPTP